MRQCTLNTEAKAHYQQVDDVTQYSLVPRPGQVASFDVYLHTWFGGMPETRNIGRFTGGQFHGVATHAESVPMSLMRFLVQEYHRMNFGAFSCPMCSH